MKVIIVSEDNHGDICIGTDLESILNWLRDYKWFDTTLYTTCLNMTTINEINDYFADEDSFYFREYDLTDGVSYM